MEKEVCCLSCGKNVTVSLISYGDGYVALCPKCDKIAYTINSKNVPDLKISDPNDP